MDPALIGVVGTGSGAIIGYLGTVTTAWLTRKREERARSYEERKTAYIDLLGHLDNAYRAYLKKTHDPDSLSLEEYQESIMLLSKMGATLTLIAPHEVRELTQNTLDVLFDGPKPGEDRKTHLAEFHKRRNVLAEVMRKELGLGTMHKN